MWKNQLNIIPIFYTVTSDDNNNHSLFSMHELIYVSDKQIKLLACR